MDRQLLVVLVLTLLALSGCSRSKSPPPTATANSVQRAPAAKDNGGFSGAGVGQGEGAYRPGIAADGGSSPTETHRPLTRDSAEDMQHWPPAQGQQQESTRSFRTEIHFPDDVVEGNLARPPSTFADQPGPTAASPDGSTGNPLRNSPAAAARSANPLRIARDEGRIPPSPDSPGSWEAKPPVPPEHAIPNNSPAGGSAPPTEELLAGAPPQWASGLPDYDVVEVFYGTDRHIAAAVSGDWQHVLARFVPTGCGALVTLGLALFAISRRALVPWLVTVGSLGVSLGLGYHAASTTLAALRYAGREGPQYSSDRSSQGHIDRGVCQVTIPKKHLVGEVESPSLTRLEIVEDASKHVVLQKTERLADAQFYDLLRQRVEQSDRREVFVFVHGFNVSFADAARRTAQIHHDLRFDGAPLFFSWPAHDKFIFTYPADETNVAWSVPHLKQFLLEIVKESQARSINLIAHSMGNRALAAALREIELEMRDSARLFNQVILAAPDIDADDFRNNIAPAMQRTAQRLTLYASSRDDALLASQLVHRGPRAGDAGEGLVIIPGIDTIDVTAIDSSPWGHSYYGSSDPVLHDLQTLFSRAIPPRDRGWLSPAQRDGLTYWIFQPTRTASAADGDSAR